MTRAFVCSSNDERWDDWIGALPHDVYHTAAYHRVAEASGEGKAFLACYGREEKRFAWPFLLREVTSAACAGCRDVSCVYGYPGPLLGNCDCGDPFLDEAAGFLVETWTSMRTISVFSRFHPILQNQRWAATLGQAVRSTLPTQTGANCRLVQCGETVSIDLTLSDQACEVEYQRRLRCKVHRLQRLGMSTAIDEDWAALPEFMEMYRSTMDRNGASEEYYFPGRYFKHLRSELGSHALLAVSRFEGAAASASILLEFNGFLAIHLAATSVAHLHLSPYKLLIDDVRRLGAARGDSVLHLGGGRGGSQDSLFQFKAHFSPRRHPYHIGCWILNSGLYRELCQERKTEAERAGMEPACENYFPEYRTPLRERVAVHVAG